ncbi:cellulose-binding domain-containing protein [Streptomyces violaceorubidus]
MRTRLLRLLRRPWTAAVAAVALVVSVLVAMPASGAAAAACRVDYTVDAWAGGHTARVRVTNLGPAVNDWRLTWTYTGDQQVTSAWNATVTQSGASVVAVDAGWNGALSTGGTAEFGVQGTWRSADPVPDDFALNGSSCGGDGGTPPTTPPTTAPATTPPTTPPATTPPPSAECGDAVICSGFEDQTGPEPAGDWRFTAPDCQGTGTVAVDSAVAHGGRQVAAGGRPGRLLRPRLRRPCRRICRRSAPCCTPACGSRHTTALPTSQASPSCRCRTRRRAAGRSAWAARTARCNGTGESDDATLPAQSPAGVALGRPLPTDGWAVPAVRGRHLGRPPGQLARRGAGPRPARRRTVPTQDVDQQWLARGTAPRPTALAAGLGELRDGRRHPLWFDDVAVGSRADRLLTAGVDAGPGRPRARRSGHAGGPPLGRLRRAARPVRCGAAVRRKRRRGPESRAGAATGTQPCAEPRLRAR